MVTLMPPGDHCICFLGFLRSYPFCGGRWARIRFWEDLWGNQPLCRQFPNLFRVVIVRNALISSIIDTSFPSWNLSFRHNLTDVEIEDLEKVLSFSHVLLILSIPDMRDWLSPFGIFAVKSLLSILFNLLALVLFSWTKLIWQSKAPSKVKAFACLVAKKKVNTNDLLQVRRPHHKVFNCDCCIMCMRSGNWLIISFTLSDNFGALTWIIRIS